MIYNTFIKDNLGIFEPDNQEILRRSQPENFFTGPYKKPVAKRRHMVSLQFFIQFLD